jgi:thiol-disulfide isomerase/thioredoxin
MKAKKKQKQERRPSARLLIGLVVGIVIVAVIGIKIATTQRSAAVAVAPAPSVATAPTGAPNPTTAQAPMRPKPPSSTLSAASNDLFPASPAAQVQWVTRNKKPAMILYHSTNCIPCKAMDQLVKKVRADYEPAVVFVDVITNDQANLPEIRRAKIQVIPTTFFVSSSGQIKKQVGAMPEDALRAELARLQAGN